MDELILGFDLCNDYSQVSVYRPGEKEPYTVIFGEGDFADQVSTTVCKKKGEDKWLIGEDGFRTALFGKGTTVNKLIRQVMKNGTATVEGVCYTAEDLLCFFLEAALEHTKYVTGKTKIGMLVFTLQNMDIKFMDTLIICTDRLGIEREKVHIISHTESFLYSVLSQSRDLWANTVALFNLTEEGLHYYEMAASRGGNRVVQAHHEFLEEGFSVELLESQAGCKMADSILLPCAERLMQKKVFSAVYLTGKGFANCQSWATSFLKYICNKRRVFVGDSMFAKGAALRAADFLREKTEYPYLFSCEGCLTSSVTMEVLDKGIRKKMFLAEAGKNWYESKTSVELILDGAEPIELEVIPAGSRDSKKVPVWMDEFPVRDRFTTRVEINAAFTAENILNLWIRDLGFGEIYPSSGKVVKQVIRL